MCETWRHGLVFKEFCEEYEDSCARRVPVVGGMTAGNNCTEEDVVVVGAEHGSICGRKYNHAPCGRAAATFIENATL